MIQVIKIAIAIMLFLCLVNFPYGFYQFVRIAASIGFCILAFDAYRKNNAKEFVIIYVGLAILFQPVIKISLGRFIWNIVDVIVGVSLLLSIILLNKKRRE